MKNIGKAKCGQCGTKDIECIELVVKHALGIKGKHAICQKCLSKALLQCKKDN